MSRLDRLKTLSRSRGSATLGLAVVVAAVAGGMALGSGVARHHVASGYDLVWVPDAKRGQIVQVDPSAHKANLRLQVAPAGHKLSLQQGNGHLIVTDQSTGKSTSIDLSTLLVGGTRTDRLDPSGAGVKVLLDGSRMYVANLASGLVQAVDPATQKSIGKPWTAGGKLVDVVIDGNHAMWALDGHNHLIKLTWSNPGQTLSAGKSTDIKGGGTGSVVVGHDNGVTVVGAGGVITRVGTSSDGSVDAPKPTGGLTANPTSPGDLVPVADPGNSSVVIVNHGNPLVDNVSVMGCPTPGSPVAFNDLVYVPCLGSAKVLVLDRSGQQAGAAVRIPTGGDPQLLIGDGKLLITVPGAAYTTVIDRSGAATQIQVVDPTIGVQHPSDPPPPPPAPTPTPTHPSGNPPSHNGGGHHNGGGWGGGNGDGGGNSYGGGNGGGSSSGGAGSGSGSAPGGHQSGSPTSSVGTSGAPSGTPGGSGHPSGTTSASGSASPTGSGPAPSGAATAAPQGDGSVVVSWTSANDKGATYKVFVVGGNQVADAAAGATSATVTVLAPGTTASFEVQAYLPGSPKTAWVADTAQVTTYAAPGAVTGVTVAASRSGDSASLAVSWTPAAGNGRTVSYVVSAAGAADVGTSATAATLVVPCPTSCSGTVTVTPNSDAGNGAAGSADYNSAAPPPPPANPSPGETVVTVANETDGYDNGDGTASPAVVTVNLTAPADWAASVGTSCELFADAVDQGAVACNSSGVARDFTYPLFGTHDHSYYVTATWSGGSAQSATVTATTFVPRANTCVNAASYHRLGVHGSAVTPEVAQCQPCNSTCGPIPLVADQRQLGTAPAATTRRDVHDTAALPWYRQPQ